MKIQKFCKWLVVVMFIVGIFAVSIGTVASYPHKLIESVTRNSIVDQYMGDNPSLAERIKARFLSFENTVNSYLFGRDAGLSLNIAMQKAMGKQILQFGSDRMVTLNTGHLYDLVPEADVQEQLANVIAMRDDVFGDIPMVYVYAQSTLYDEAMLPEGVAMLDNNMAIADEVVSTLETAGVEVIDSREVLNASGYPLEELILYTDQHWSSKAGLVMAGEIAQNLADKGLPVVAENLNIENFDSKTYEDSFLGKYGQRIGAGNTRLDDMTAFWPKYDTDIHRVTRSRSTVDGDVQGRFEESVIRWSDFENDQDCDYSTQSYMAYGLTEAEEKFTNNMLTEGRILVVKDSFGASVSSFLSLCAHEVWGVDLRHSDKSIEEYVQEFQPDAVVFVYSQQVLRDFDAQ